jgi:hypothetical protein
MSMNLPTIQAQFCAHTSECTGATCEAVSTLIPAEFAAFVTLPNVSVCISAEAGIPGLSDGGYLLPEGGGQGTFSDASTDSATNTSGASDAATASDAAAAKD